MLLEFVTVPIEMPATGQDHFKKGGLECIDVPLIYIQLAAVIFHGCERLINLHALISHIQDA